MQEYRTILTTKVQKQLQQKTGLRMQAKFKQLKKVNKHSKNYPKTLVNSALVYTLGNLVLF